ncbi:8405_t:CDS:1, partial [Cetraspora pellucida]
NSIFVMSKPTTPSDNSSIDLTNEHVTTTTTFPQTNDTTITTSVLQTNDTTAPVLQIKESKRKRPIEYIEDDILMSNNKLLN